MPDMGHQIRNLHEPRLTLGDQSAQTLLLRLLRLFLRRFVGAHLSLLPILSEEGPLHLTLPAARRSNNSLSPDAPVPPIVRAARDNGQVKFCAPSAGPVPPEIKFAAV